MNTSDARYPIHRWEPITHYTKVHKYLAQMAGRANRCEVCKVEGKSRYEWALKRGCQYDFNVNNFIQMCVSCHRKYDYTDEARRKIGLSKKGKMVGSKNGHAKPLIHIGCGAFYDTLQEAANLYGLKKTTLVAMLKGQNPNKTQLRYA